SGGVLILVGCFAPAGVRAASPMFQHLEAWASLYGEAAGPILAALAAGGFWAIGARRGPLLLFVALTLVAAALWAGLWLPYRESVRPSLFNPPGFDLAFPYAPAWILTGAVIWLSLALFRAFRRAPNPESA
ncbi:MAG TPA: hypothetical protein VNC50_13795, partial [Planctomycetia bacterium]|nr:hypothetical protein [Planctomycetia bacterium]